MQELGMRHGTSRPEKLNFYHSWICYSDKRCPYTLVFPLPGPASICTGTWGSCLTAIQRGDQEAEDVHGL